MIIKVRMLEERKTFLKQHRKWFTYSGTIVLFGTFVINEAFHDRSKDLANAIRSAEDTTAILSTTAGVYRQINDIKMSMTGFRQQLLSKGERNDDPYHHDSLVMTIELTAPIDKIEQATLQRSIRVLDVMPYDQALDSRHWILQGISDVRREMVSEANQIQKLRDEQNEKEARKVETMLVSNANRMPSLYKSVNESSSLDAYDEFEKDVSDKATVLQRTAEDRARLSKNISFVLYPIGLIIGLLSRVAGDDESAGEEV